MGMFIAAKNPRLFAGQISAIRGGALPSHAFGIDAALSGVAVSHHPVSAANVPSINNVTAMGRGILNKMKGI